MGADSGRTDYMPIDEFQRRAQAAIGRGDKYQPRKLLILDVPYSLDFDVFAASVAYAIRGEVVYRSDGGVFARGLVRASTDLWKLHEFFRHPPNRPGPTVRILGFLWRRRDPVASMQWAMSIRFELPKIAFSAEEGDQIRARQDVLVGMEKDLVEKILDQGIAATQSSTWNPPNKWGIDRVRRIRDWMHLAISHGYPSLLNLWYYDRRAVFLYVQLKANLNDLSTDRQLEQKNMTLATSGALPFDGDTGAAEHLPWRHYLFREILAKCRGKDSDAIYTITGNELIHAEDEILRTIAEVQHEIQRSAQMQNVQAPMSLGPKTTLTASDSAALGGPAVAFIKHFRSLLNDPQSLYNTYTRYTQASYGLWGSF